MNKDKECCYKFWENSDPAAVDYARTWKGMSESLEGYVMLHGPGQTFTIEVITLEEYQKALGANALSKEEINVRLKAFLSS